MCSSWASVTRSRGTCRAVYAHFREPQYCIRVKKAKLNIPPDSNSAVHAADYLLSIATDIKVQLL